MGVAAVGDKVDGSRGKEAEQDGDEGREEADGHARTLAISADIVGVGAGYAAGVSNDEILDEQKATAVSSDRTSDGASVEPLDAGAERRRRVAERRRARGGGPTDLYEFNPAILVSVLPVAVFWIVRRIAETQIAIGMGFATSLIVFRYTRRQGVIGYLAIGGIVVVGGAALVGLVLDSDKAFLANDPVNDFIGVALFLGSVAIRRPLVGLIACEIFPKLTALVEPKHRVFYVLTVLWAVQNLGTGIIRIFLLEELSVDGYILWSRVITWPIALALFALSAYMVGRVAQDRRLAAALSEDGS